MKRREPVLKPQEAAIVAAYFEHADDRVPARLAFAFVDHDDGVMYATYAVTTPGVAPEPAEGVRRLDNPIPIDMVVPGIVDAARRLGRTVVAADDATHRFLAAAWAGEGNHAVRMVGADRLAKGAGREPMLQRLTELRERGRDPAAALAAAHLFVTGTYCKVIMRCWVDAMIAPEAPNDGRETGW